MALDGDDYFVFRLTDSSLWFDRDGNGNAAAIMIADLQLGGLVTASDRFIV